MYWEAQQLVFSVFIDIKYGTVQVAAMSIQNKQRPSWHPVIIEMV
jgi:hypothetical protein